jgi:hypothetical protein
MSSFFGWPAIVRLSRQLLNNRLGAYNRVSGARLEELEWGGGGVWKTGTSTRDRAARLDRGHTSDCCGTIFY